MHVNTINENVSSKSNLDSTSERSIDELKSTISDKALLRRVDLRLIPVLLIIYFLNFLDRINIGNAMTMGLQKDLKLQGDEVNTVLAVFYVTYICFEVPSNLVLRRIKPHVWLSVCLFLCGVMVICHGFVQSYGSLLAVRLLLGAAEAGLFPGCSYILVMWYTREEVISRFSIFFGAATLAGAFGSLLASAIQQMNGVGNLAGWRWVFVIEGIATCLFALVTFFKLPDFPQDVAWLSSEEKQTILLRRSTSESDDHLTTIEGLRKLITDVKSYLGILAAMGTMLAGYSITYFLPTIISGFHYSTTQTQLHAVAPFAAGLCWCIGFAFLSARVNHRLILILCNMAMGLAAVSVLYHVNTVRVAYAMTFLFSMSVFGTIPLVFCWFFTNLRGHTETSIGSAALISAGNLGGIIATYAFVKSEAPHYHRGYGLCMMGFGLTAVSSTAYAVSCRLSNRSRNESMKLVDR